MNPRVTRTEINCDAKDKNSGRRRGERERARELTVRLLYLLVAVVTALCITNYTR